MCLGIHDADARADEERPSEPAIPRIVLPNGLVVLLSEDHKAPVVGMELRYAVGARDDPPGRPGLAALTQRLMTQASKHVGPGEYDRLLDSVSAWDRRQNTVLDRTTFLVSVPSERIALPLWMWSDQMGFFVERVDQKMLSEQITIIQNEHTQKIDAVPAGRVRDFVDAALFPSGNPYHRGSPHASRALSNTTLDDVRSFAEAHFRPDQAILSISGDFDSVRTLALVNRYFGPIRTTGQPSRATVTADAPPLDREVRLIVAARVELPMITVCWPTPADHAPDDAALDIVAQVLTGDRAGWLRWKLVDELKIAAHVWSWQTSRRLGSEFCIDATATRGHTPRELLDAIDAVLGRLQSGPPDAFSASGAVTGYLVSPLFGLEQTAYRAARYAECEEFGVRERCITGWIARHSTVKAADMSAVAARQLPLAHRVVAEVYPATDAPIAGELRDAPPGGSR